MELVIKVILKNMFTNNLIFCTDTKKVPQYCIMRIEQTIKQIKLKAKLKTETKKYEIGEPKNL
jgi:SHS2 domain-containing protein